MDISYCDLIAIVSSAHKDKEYKDAVKKMHDAFHELILAEGASRRKKTSVLIHSKARLDNEMLLFKIQYNRIKNQLTNEAIIAIEEWQKKIEQKKMDIIFEIKKLKTNKFL